MLSSERTKRTTDLSRVRTPPLSWCPRRYAGYGRLKRLFLIRVAETFSEDEVRSLRDQFVRMDKDGDGALTYNEMLEAIRSMRTGEQHQPVRDTSPCLRLP